MSKVKYLIVSILFYLFIFFVQGGLHAQQVTCHATVPTRAIEVGQVFEYSVSLNTKADQIVSTSFSHFKVLRGPSVSHSSSFSMVNGNMTSSQSYTYTYALQATAEGTFAIPGAVFSVNGQQVKANNVQVTVVKADGTNSGGSGNNARAQGQGQNQGGNLDKNDIFLSASASSTSPYQGESVTITHKLYVSDAVNGGLQVINQNLPTQNGLWTYQLGKDNDTRKQGSETVNGKHYTVYEIRKTAVFPQKSGDLTITALEMEVAARVIFGRPSNSIWDDFFGGGQQARDHRLKIQSNSIKLHVKPLPSAGQPDSFSGLAGNFTMSTHLSREQLKTNEAANLVITVSGTGNLQHVELPALHFPPDFDVAEPRVSDKINTSGNTVSGSRTFEYIIIPRAAGSFNIPAATFSYFDLASHAYKTLSSKEYTLKVEKGEGEPVSSTTPFAAQKDIKMLDRDIRYIKTNGQAFAPREVSLFGSVWHFSGILIPVALFLLFLLIWRKQIEARRDITGYRDRHANKVARKRLRAAHQLLQNNQQEPFYEEISRVLWGYMSDKFHIPLANLSMNTVEEKLQAKGLPAEHISEFMNTLQQCEFARFAPGDPSQLMHDMYQSTLSFITRIEKK
ncbi:MAG: BatD family protein [Bacteroidales bacterium]|jgi:hypothetical protein|nr:BatD family protein [Bacteroidales bacterium]